jgi:predicted transposase/invertase (TIGR01784 family)
LLKLAVRKVEKCRELAYNNTMSEIDKIHDKLFKETFKKKENAETLMKKVLPEEIKKRLDFSDIEVGPTDYVSKKFKDFFSDIVIKTKIKSKKGKRIDTDVCLILEHKIEGRKTIFIQFLQYMVHEWQKDIDEKKPLRIIIPLVFYHGEKDWKVPRAFVDQFEVDDEVKAFLLNYRYILFDTKSWDFRNENNQELKNNIFLLTAMAMMKYFHSDDTESILEIFKFWHEKGFTDDVENVVFFLIYISDTRNISVDQLKKMLEESKIDGGEIMQTLGQRLRDEGKEKWIKEGKFETAKRMLNDGLPIESIVKYTGLTEKEIKALTS